jgi:uncharacterized protein YhaN
MIIRALTVTNLKRLKDRTVQFGPGLTVVKGPNEAGKSTLQWALLLALFGDSHSRSSALTQSRTWGQDDLFRIGLDFDWDGHAFKLERDFEAKTDRLTDVCTGEETNDKNAIAARLSEFLGIGTEELFRSTACVTQNSIAAISAKGKQQVSQQLQAVMTGGGEDTAATQAMTLLLSQVANLRRGLDRPASNPGAIKESQDAIARLQQDLVSRKSEADRTMEADRVIQESENGLRTKSERLEAVRVLVANCDKRASLCSQRDSETEAEDAVQREIDSVEKLRGDIREKKDAMESFRALSELPPDTPQALATLEATLRVHVSAEKSAEEDFERASVGVGSVVGRRLPGIGSVVALVIAVALVVAGHYIGFAISIAVAAGLLLIFQSRRSEDKDAVCKLEEAEERLGRIRAQIQAAYDEQQLLVKSSGCATAEELRRQWSEWSQMRLETAKLEAEMAGKLAGKSLERLEEERRQRSRRRRDAEEQLETSEMAAADLHPLERQQISLEAQRLEGEIAELERARTSADALIDAIHLDPSEIYSLEESLSSVQDRLERTERLARVYTVAAEGIREAVGQTLRGVKPILEEQTGKYLSLVTGGKYSKVIVDEQSLDFQIFSDEKSDKVYADGGELSRGALDQFYLAARMAMLDMVSSDTKPLVLLDDPFVTFDDDRARRAMDLVKQISRDRQAILFTYSDRYDGFADHIVALS